MSDTEKRFMSIPVRIEITNYCNRRCDYCFFNDRLTSYKDEMTLEEFNYILDLCDREDRKFVFLQGGEPTSHSDFAAFIDILKKRGFRYGLFTNGIFKSDLIDRLKVDKEDEILINYNHPGTYLNIKEWELVNRNLEKLASRNISFNLGYNLYQDNPDYGYFIDAIKKYKINHVRWDIARPSEKFTNRFFQFNDYFKLIPVMVNFIKAYMKEGCYFNYDCPLPMCVLLRKEFNFINHNTDVTKLTSCGALLNIGPGLNLATCPASVVFKDIKLSDFSGLSTAEAFLRQEVDKVRWGVWLSDNCDECIYRVMRECQGGCIGHKRVKCNNIVDRKALELFFSENKSISSVCDETLEMLVAPAEKVTRCINRYNNDLKKGPPDQYSYYSLGRSYELLEDYDNAIKVYEEVLKQDSSCLIANDRLNLVYQLKVVKQNPRNLGAWMRLENALEKMTGDKKKRDSLVRQYKARYAPNSQ